MEVIYKILNGLYPSYLNDIIICCQARFLVPRFSTIRYGQKSVSYVSPVLWNTLDNDDIKLYYECTSDIKEGSYVYPMPNIRTIIRNNYVDDHWLDILQQSYYTTSRAYVECLLNSLPKEHLYVLLYILCVKSM